MTSPRTMLSGALLALVALLILPSTGSAAPGGGGGQDQSGHPDENRAREIKLLGRILMERVEDHRERLERIDKLIQFHRKQGNLDKIREMERLRQREVTAFQKTLGEYRRLLGDRDFERLGRAVRFLVEREHHNSIPTEEVARTGPSGGAAKASPARPAGRPSVERTLQRQLSVEQARASQRMALSRRLQLARQQQLRLMAEQQRRYQPATPPARAGAGERPGVGQRPGATPQRQAPQRQAPPRRRP